MPQLVRLCCNPGEARHRTETVDANALIADKASAPITARHETRRCNRPDRHVARRSKLRHHPRPAPGEAGRQALQGCCRMDTDWAPATSISRTPRSANACRRSRSERWRIIIQVGAVAAARPRWPSAGCGDGCPPHAHHEIRAEAGQAARQPGLSARTVPTPTIAASCRPVGHAQRDPPPGR